MNDLGAPWPIATRNKAFAALAGLFALLLVLQFADRPISVWGQDLPEPIPGIMHWITRWGESDWQLIPALLVFLLTLAVIPLVRSEIVSRAGSSVSGPKPSSARMLQEATSGTVAAKRRMLATSSPMKPF